MAATFPSIYRARATQINGGAIQAYVPQVFGESAVTVNTYLGGQPSAPTMGWIVFQGGNPEFPVWAGNLGEGAPGGGTGGGGVDEVWVNNNAPINPDTELWYDPDATLLGLPASQVSFTPTGTVAATNVQTAIAEVAVDAAAAITPPAWIPLGSLLVSGWVNYGAPFGPAYYRKVGDMVQLRGLISTGSSNSATICTLPVGYRPLYQPIINTPCQLGVAEIRIDTNGVMNSPAAYPAGAIPTIWLSLHMAFSVT